MGTQLVTCSIESGIATLMLNRPGKLNALTYETFERLRVQLDLLADDDGIRCLVLTGAGRSFCAGHDLDSLAAGDALAHSADEAAAINQLEAMPMPTIAKIHGPGLTGSGPEAAAEHNHEGPRSGRIRYCLTGGLELALGCDLLIAGESAQLGYTHSQWGLVPLWGMSVRLPERVGMSRAKRLTFTAERIDGRAAADIGLVDEAVPDDELDEHVARLAARIAANSPGSNRICKSLYANTCTIDRATALDTENRIPFGLPGDTAQRLAGARK